jgi:methionyl-tRNA formyltransferase
MASTQEVLDRLSSLDMAAGNEEVAMKQADGAVAALAAKAKADLTVAELPIIVKADVQGSAEAIVQALDDLARDALPRQPQPQAGVTYAAKIERADAIIDWIEPAQAIVNRVRAFDPAPGCVTVLERAPEQPLKVWRAAPATLSVTPVASGTVLAVSPDALTVACGPAHAPQAVSLLELQRPGGRRMPVRAFLGGFAIQPGDRLCAPPASPHSSSPPST